MRSRILAGVLMFIGILAAGTFASSGANVAPDKQWALANFSDVVRVNGNLLMGPYLVVHDNAKMARGEPCTTFYRFEPGKGPQESEATFMCKPAERTVCDKFTFSVVPDNSYLGIKRMTEFQFAGDSEGHGIPER
jgi:hypothetical protein